MRHSRTIAVLLLLAILIATPPPRALVRAQAPPDAPLTYRGRISYIERGPGASVNGILTALMLGAAAPIYVARIARVVDLLTQVPGLGDTPTMQTVSEFLNQGVPIDLARELPIDAKRTITLDFVLQEAEDDMFQLQSGILRWESSNSGEFSYDGVTMRDSFAGSGSHTLDPSIDTITLQFDAESDPPQFMFEVDVHYPERVDGESVWAGPQNTFEITLEAVDGTHIMDGSALGMPLSSVGAPTPMTIIEGGDENSPMMGLSYYRQAPLDELEYGVETWRTLSDGQAVIEYDIHDECRLEIASPAAGDKWTFGELDPGTVVGDAEATIKPGVWADHIEWTLPEIDGSERDLTPEDRRGARLHYEYEGLPESNDAFGPQEVAVAFTELGERCDTCQPQVVRLFFPREATNNPEGETPNWFYYWSQTGAAQGHADQIVYAGECEVDEGFLDGYYRGVNDPDEADVIYICDLGMSGFQATNPLTGKRVSGIDHFASVVLHEWTHLENYHDWWGAGGYDATRDRDDDLIPDDREAAYGLDPRLKDTFGVGFCDAEIPAYLQEHTWPNGSVNHQDWADPGKQSGGGR